MTQRSSSPNQTPLFISVHLPKTAGTSFADSLGQAFGDGLRLDYDERPLNRHPAIRKLRALKLGAAHARRGICDDTTRCIHGHILPIAYSRFRDRGEPVFLTWLRHPLDRLQSHYNYWLDSYEEQTAGALHRRVVEEAWSFERFALSRELKDIYQAFLWRFPAPRFTFIGITEYYAEDLAYLSEEVLRSPVPESRKNVGNSQARAELALSGSQRARIEKHHARDFALYEWALRQRRRR